VNNTANKLYATVPRLLILAVVGFVLLVAVILFFKEDINLALVPESQASVELNISSVQPNNNIAPSEDLLPSQQYVQSLLNDPNNFDTEAFEKMLPAQSLMHSKDMFLVGF